MPDGSARGTMAGTLPAVAYSVEVKSDGSTTIVADASISGIERDA